MTHITRYNMLRSKFKYATANTIDLLSRLLTYDPKQRITAEEALRHPYFRQVYLSARHT
jgi:cell division cycle 2-like protein